MLDLFEKEPIIVEGIRYYWAGPSSPNPEQCNGVEHIFRLYMEQNKSPPLS